MAARRILVGVDGSPSSIHALRWAAHHHQEGDVIEAMLTWDYPVLALLPAPIGSVVPPTAAMNEAAAESLAKSVAEVTADYDVEIIESVRYGTPAESLLQASTGAEMIVVGIRGASVAKVLLGSVSRRVLHHARVPVVVVPHKAPLDYEENVVVGIDGSVHSTAALAWARKLSTGRIDVIHTWQMATTYPPYMPPIPAREIETVAEAVTERVIDEVLDGDTDARLNPVVLLGDPRVVLPASGFEPGLIVMGARGYSGLAGALVGSVTDHVASHADVAVAVIPAIEEFEE